MDRSPMNNKVNIPSIESIRQSVDKHSTLHSVNGKWCFDIDMEAVISELLEATDQNIKVAAPLPGVGPNGPSLTPTASAPDCLVGEPVVDATTANKPQRETFTPLENCWSLVNGYCNGFYCKPNECDMRQA